MARPRFKIDPARLRALRIEKGLTQTATAEKVAHHLGKPNTQSLGRHYQRIEDTGQTSSKYAQALATVLGVPTPILQGMDSPEPDTYLQNVRNLLEEQLATGNNAALQRMLEKYADASTDEAMAYLTEDVAEDIEQVLLVRNPGKIASLTDLTGMSEADLLAPANVQGFWFISVSSQVTNCTEIVNGAVEVNYRISEIVAEFLATFGNDSRLRMWRDAPWFRVEIERPQVRDVMCIDFTRCQAESSGLKWIDASWRDTLFLNPGIVEHAYANADFVTDFSGKTVPEDLMCLRIVVTENDRTGKVLRRMIVRGAIDEMPESVKDNFIKESSGRMLFISWLTVGLKDALLPHLRIHPASAWQVKIYGGSALEISLNNSRLPGDFYPGLNYRIMLVEESSPHAFGRVPVRRSDLDQMKEKIEGWLNSGDTTVDHDAPVPDFETV